MPQFLGMAIFVFFMVLLVWLIAFGVYQLIASAIAEGIRRSRR